MAKTPQRRRSREPSWRSALLFLGGSAIGLFLLSLVTLLVAASRSQDELREAVVALQGKAAPLTEAAWRDSAGIEAQEPAPEATPAIVGVGPGTLALRRVLAQGPTTPNLHDYRNGRNLPPTILRLREGTALSAEEIRAAGDWLAEREVELEQLREETEGQVVSMNERYRLQGGMVLTRLQVRLALEERDDDAALAALRVHRELVDRLARIYRLGPYGDWVNELESLHRWGVELAEERADFDLGAWFEVLALDDHPSSWRHVLTSERLWFLESRGVLRDGQIRRVELGRFDDSPDRWSPYAEWNVLRNLEAIERALARLEGAGVPEPEPPWYASSARVTQRTVERIESSISALAELRSDPKGGADR